jgi:hypothetical protein
MTMIIPKKTSILRPLGYLWIASIAILSSCEEKVDFTAGDTQSVENEAATDAYFEDTEDMSAIVVAADAGTMSGSRTSAGRNVSKDKLDGRFACESTTVTLIFADDNSQAIPHGFITIDFGTTGCTDARGNIRKGKINIEFKGRRFAPGSSITTTFQGYEVNGVKLEGIRTVANAEDSQESAPKFIIVLAGGKATWPDGTVATREVNRTRIWTRATNPLNDTWTISGTASGTNRNEKVYDINITKPLVYKRECALSSRIFMAVEGTKELTVDGKRIIIDYGSGECDRLVTITINGESREVEVKGDM